MSMVDMERIDHWIEVASTELPGWEIRKTDIDEAQGVLESALVKLWTTSEPVHFRYGMSYRDLFYEHQDICKVLRYVREARYDVHYRKEKGTWDEKNEEN